MALLLVTPRSGAAGPRSGGGGGEVWGEADVSGGKKPTNSWAPVAHGEPTGSVRSSPGWDPTGRRLRLLVLPFYGGVGRRGRVMPIPSTQAAYPKRVGGRGEEEGHAEWRGSDTCGPTGVGSWPL